MVDLYFVILLPDILQCLKKVTGWDVLLRLAVKPDLKNFLCSNLAFFGGIIRGIGISCGADCVLGVLFFGAGRGCAAGHEGSDHAASVARHQKNVDEWVDATVQRRQPHRDHLQGIPKLRARN